jgi:CBS domain-containing protein/ribosome-associated translation inhibitor RaiA
MTKTLAEIGQTKISELLNKPFSIFLPEDTASKVLGELEKSDGYEALVSVGDKVGLVTIRDLLNIEQPDQTKLEGLWKHLTPVTSDSLVQSVATDLVRLNARALPVVENLKPVGIISQVEIVDALADCPELKKKPAKELARLLPVIIDADSKVAEARKIMLEKGFSHIPVIKEGKLIGIVTAQDIVHLFTVSIGRSKTGVRQGSKLTRFPGAIISIMDRTPLTVGPDANAFDVAKGMRNNKKSACLIVDENDVVHGIITPRELLFLIAEPKVEHELPIAIVGLTDEDFFERSIAEEKIRRVLSRNIRMHPEINEVTIKIKKQDKEGIRIRYDIAARIISPREQWSASADGWDLLATFDELLDSLSKVLMKAKREPSKTSRRGRGRS